MFRSWKSLFYRIVFSSIIPQTCWAKNRLKVNIWALVSSAERMIGSNESEALLEKKNYYFKRLTFRKAFFFIFKNRPLDATPLRTVAPEIVPSGAASTPLHSAIRIVHHRRAGRFKRQTENETNKKIEKKQGITTCHAEQSHFAAAEEGDCGNFWKVNIFRRWRCSVNSRVNGLGKWDKSWEKIKMTARRAE